MSLKKQARENQKTCRWKINNVPQILCHGQSHAGARPEWGPSEKTPSKNQETRLSHFLLGI